MSRARLIGSLKYRNLRYAQNHPLRIPRVSLLLEFLRALSLIEEEELVESRPATPEEILLFHSRDYLEALMEADRSGRVPPGARERFNIGSYENPVSPATFRGSVLAAGSSVQAVELFLEGFAPFNPAGGMHHAFRDRANGFCFINDPVIALEVLRSRGFNRILYIDLDAHHCDGVQSAYYETDEVFTFSLHQSPDFSFPFRSGFLHERGKGKGEGYTLNVPFPPSVTDDEFLFLLERTLPRIAEFFDPEVYVVQLGTDALLEDPLSRLCLSNRGLLEAFRLVREILGEGIYLGGGGYNPVALVRAWTLIWCDISGREPPRRINPEAEGVLRSVGWENPREEVDEEPLYRTLQDSWRGSGVRDEIRKLALELKALIEL